ncbi:hypothetical protein [Shimia sp. MMG029]|uniref:hypothetical protein n=1 Tax=Shimia sp. MMG029 TaxID=3021978 RepID=UPI0022FE02CE|nr:hypothetical protein [Shimia sp. MMG029]MDA5558696.1 hypothetical protein [Shimia sp. MMG029]
MALALPFAFDIATDQADDADFETLSAQIEHHGGEDIWGMIKEARSVSNEALKTASAARWAELINLWMGDSNAYFLNSYVEYMALAMMCPAYYGSKRVPLLAAELAELEVSWRRQF